MGDDSPDVIAFGLSLFLLVSRLFLTLFLGEDKIKANLHNAE